MGRNSRRTGVEVEPVVEAADLDFLLDLLDPRAAPDRPTTAAGAIARLENAAVVTGLAELVSRRHAGQPGAEDDDRRAGPRTRREIGRAGVGHRHRQQPESLHGDVGRAVAAGERDAVDESPSCQPHVAVPSLLRQASSKARRRRPNE